MNHPPRNQHELSELEERTPKTDFDRMQDRMARTRINNSIADGGVSPVPRPSLVQARANGHVLCAALRRLVSDLNWAIETPRVDVRTSQVVRASLGEATKVLAAAAEWEGNDGTE